LCDVNEHEWQQQYRTRSSCHDRPSDLNVN
jgi:hypothetical protein